MANMDESGSSFGTDEAINATVARSYKDTVGRAEATGSEHIRGAGGDSVTPTAEEAGGGAKATWSEQIEGASGISIAPSANQGVESKQVCIPS